MTGFSPVPLPSLGTLFDPTGQGSSGAPGPLPSIALDLQATGAHVLAADVGSFTFTGKTAALDQGHRLACAAGSFTLTGNAINLVYGVGASLEASAPLPSLASLLKAVAGLHLLSAATGSFFFSGRSATLSKGRGLSCQSGTFVFNGAPSQSDYVLDLDKGSFTFTPKTAALLKGRPPLVAAAGSFVFSGKTAGLSKQTTGSSTVFGAPGAYVFAGSPASFLFARKLVAQPGSFSFAGSPAAFQIAGPKILNADAGSFVFQGNPVAFVTSVVVPANTTVSVTYGGGGKAKRSYAGGGASGDAWAEIELAREKERAAKREKDLLKEIRALRKLAKPGATAAPIARASVPAAPAPERAGLLLAPQPAAPQAPAAAVDPQVQRDNLELIMRLLEEGEPA